MSMIRVANLTFGYEGSYEDVFENVSFQMDTKWKLGLIGRNGKGKTTLLHLLMGKYPYKGEISTNAFFDYFPYQVQQTERTTVDVLEEMDPQYEFWKVMREMNDLHMSEDLLFRPFQTLSYGERTKIELAVLFAKENAFLLLDEPTNHLDVEGRKIVADYLNQKQGFILVSHDRAFLDGCVDHILSINRNSIEVQKGNFSSWYENKKRKDQFELAENAKIKKELKHLKEASKRTGDWADRSERSKIGHDPIKQRDWKGRRPFIGEKTRKMQARKKDIQQKQRRAIEQKSELLKDIEEMESLKLHPKQHFKKQLICCRDLQIQYNDREIFRPLSFEIQQGDRVVLKGSNGCGKSSLIKLILGEAIDYKGALEKASQLEISYVSQDTSMLKGTLRDYAQEKGIEESLLKSILRKLDFERETFDRNMESFSQGQKKKVLIAASLCDQAHLYLWDEPLNYIDIFSRMQIEELLETFRPTMLFVEHDRTFADRIATKAVPIFPLESSLTEER